MFKRIDHVWAVKSLQDILDYYTYFLNLSRADGEKEINWEFLYGAKVWDWYQTF